MSGLLETIRRNRAARGPAHDIGEIHCHAYGGPCGHDCFLRHHCRARPQDVMRVMTLVDEQLIAALYRLGKDAR